MGEAITPDKPLATDRVSSRVRRLLSWLNRLRKGVVLMAKRRSEVRSPIFCAEPYRNENADISFGAALVGAVQAIRQDIATLAERKEVDEYAPGSLHALRKLCEGEERSLHIHKQEVMEWRETMFHWLDRVEASIPRKLRAEFRLKLEEDFRVILASAGGSPVLFSREEANTRYLPVPFASDEALQKARAAADRKYPVELGSALHEYLEECIRKLLNDP
jgi:hypothetical protein